MNTKSETPSATASRSLPSFCFGFIALVPNSHKSWSFPTRAKLAKLSRSLNRLPQKESPISPVTSLHINLFHFSHIINTDSNCTHVMPDNYTTYGMSSI